MIGKKASKTILCIVQDRSCEVREIYCFGILFGAMRLGSCSAPFIDEIRFLSERV
tara:strand:+ start:1976 stop:2140 length:165 start_codon:yes stop_codon:yes gene_type:complete